MAKSGKQDAQTPLSAAPQGSPIHEPAQRRSQPPQERSPRKGKGLPVERRLTREGASAVLYYLIAYLVMNL